MEITLTLMILELLVCTGSFICSILQFKPRINKGNKISRKNNKPHKDRNHKD